MKNLLVTTAIATMAMAGTASAQSVLERVLDQTNAINDDVTGIFANTADNVGSSAGSVTEEPRQLEAGDVIYVGTDSNDNPVFGEVQADGSVIGVGGDLAGDTLADDGTNIVASDGNATDLVAPIGASLANGDEGLGLETAAGDIDSVSNAEPITVELTESEGLIDGSITNVASRIDEATANVDNQVTATQSVTANFGNMASTVLGAVNTGEIGLGANQAVDEAIADSSEAVRSTINQVGTNTGETVLAVNSALNTMDINGSISNTFEGVNASVAAVSPDQLDIMSDGGQLEVAGVDELLGSMETTVLGAVNTGTIVSGVNNQVQGTVAGIVGNSATNMFDEGAAQ